MHHPMTNSTFPDMYALVLQLRAAGAGELPQQFGHQAQALFLDLVRQVDPELSARLHADGPAKPYTVAALLPEGRPQAGRLALAPGGSLRLRVTLLEQALFGPFTRALLSQGARPALRLGPLPLQLADVRGTPGSDPWAGFGNFAELAQAARPCAAATFHFVTPAAFSQGSDEGQRKRFGLFPEPSALFASLARRWNLLAPEPLDPQLVERAASQAVVARYELRSHGHSLGRTVQLGFVGHCSYELRGGPEERRALALLANAAFYLGIGVKTARGMGLCRARLEA